MQRVDSTDGLKKDVCLSSARRSRADLYQDKHTFYRQFAILRQRNVCKILNEYITYNLIYLLSKKTKISLKKFESLPKM